MVKKSVDRTQDKTNLDELKPQTLKIRLTAFEITTEARTLQDSVCFGHPRISRKCLKSLRDKNKELNKQISFIKKKLSTIERSAKKSSSKN